MPRSLLSILWAALAGGAATVRALDSFETDTAGWHAVGGSVAVSADHGKLGTHSLRWDFTPGSTLVRAADDAQAAALKLRDGGLKLWVYGEQPVNGPLRFRVGPWAFTVNLGFTGWRAVWVQFSEDAEKAEPAAGLQVTAPDVTGTLFLDAVELGSAPWFRQGDAQTPYTNASRANGAYWYTAQDEAAVPPPAPPAALSAEDVAAFREIERRYEAWMFGRLDDPRAPVRARLEGVKGCIRWGQKAYDKLGLVRRGEIVNGPGAFCLVDPRAPHLSADVFQEIALPLAYDVRLNQSEPAAQRFLDLIDYARDQGWAAGSLMGTGYGEPLRIAGYVHAVYILRDLLRERGRLGRELETLRYQLSLGEIYRVPEHGGANADDLRTLFLFRLLYVLLLDDSPEKLRDLLCLQRWANAALATAPGYGDTIKPDGTVFHHQTAYACAYGNDAVLMSSLTYWLLSGTRFALSAEAGGNLKRALLTLRFMAGQYDFPMGVSGRWPFSDPALLETAPAFAYLAAALNDAELGAAFARLWGPELPGVKRSFASSAARIYWCDSPGALPWLLDARAGYTPEAPPQGHRAYPFAAMDFHRRRQWVASVRGWSQYVWNYENGASENRYGRYSSYGMLQVFAKGEPVNREASGYREAGWDWLRPPGATVIRVPLEDLNTAKVLARSYTRDPFVGGVALEGQNGLWAMRFADPLYEPSFRFRKSVFCVDETLVCLGSGIANADAEHPTETVLYQVALATRPEPFPQTERRETRWLLDPVGNGYFFPERQVVELRTQHQESMDSSGARKTAGDVAVAWLDHGRAPAGAGYAYAIRPDTTAEAMERYAAAPDVEVLRRDDTAHIVRFPGRAIVGYALFAAVEDLQGEALNGAEAPCLVTTRRDGERLILAVADPDLRLPAYTPQTTYQPGAEGHLRLHLHGAWRLLSGPPNARAVDAHTLDLTCRDGASYELILQPQ
jgi:hypothetical protein